MYICLKHWPLHKVENLTRFPAKITHFQFRSLHLKYKSAISSRFIYLLND